LKDEDRLKSYQAMAETTRKWVSVLDTKAGFLSGLNGMLLGFLWGLAKLPQGAGWSAGFSMVATVLLLASVIIALSVVIPRVTLAQVFRSKVDYSRESQPVSFYGYVAQVYPISKADEFLQHVSTMSAADMCREAIEQHFTISHLASRKNRVVTMAGQVSMWAMLLTILAVIARGV
jgi:hypothetical protein